MGLDVFIREKFGGLEKDYFGEGETVSVHVNPGFEYIVQDNDVAFILANKEQ